MQIKRKYSNKFIIARVSLALLDCFLILLFSILSHFNILFIDNVSQTQLLVASLSIALSVLLTIILFFVFKVYLILTTQTTMIDVIEIILIAFIVNIVIFLIECIGHIFWPDVFASLSIITYLCSIIALSLLFSLFKSNG